MTDDIHARSVDELEVRLARLELTLLEVVTAVGMLVGELALRDDLTLTTPDAVENALEHGWQALVGARPGHDSFGVTIDGRFAAPEELAAAGPPALERAVVDTGAAVGAFYAITGDEAALLASHGYPDDVIQSFARFPLSADLPAATAARTRRPLWFGAREQILDTYPHLRDVHEETEAELGLDDVQGAVVPLVANGDVVGVAIVGFGRGDAAPDASRLQAVRHRLSASLGSR